MIHIETNIYRITNLNQLNCKFRLYKVRGLSPGVEEYHRNTQLLVDILSRMTKSPCHFFTTNEGGFIAQPEGFQNLPDTFKAIRTTVKIEPQPNLHELKFDSHNPLHLALIRRFLQFSLQNPLYNNPALWQPRAGYPFYHKSPDTRFSTLSNTVDLYRGFTFRIVFINDGIAICADTASKYVAREPLPTRIKRNDINTYKGVNCLYEYGETWYEIKIDGLHDLTASEVILPDNCTLFDHIHRKSGTKKSPRLLALPNDCSVLSYRNATGATRNAPSGLCRQTYTTDHPEIRNLHPHTIKPPHQRRAEIQYVVDRYLRNLEFRDKQITLSDKPLAFTPKQIPIPKLQFGQGKVLSVEENGNSIRTSLTDFGNKKKELLYAKDAGPFVRKPLDSQYFILPRSVHETFGAAFINDLKTEANRLLTESEDTQPYNPVEIPYDDSVQMSVYNLARAITTAVDQSHTRPGYGIVMIPRLPSKRIKEDELANLIMRELRNRGLHASVIHTTVPTESYEYSPFGNGEQGWKIKEGGKQRSKAKGYLKGVALNKILLLNSLWPFILKTHLHADLTIGIDVKNNVAGLSFVYKTGEDIRFFTRESNDKEQLSKKHIKSRLLEYLQEEKQILAKHQVKQIVIHRQGKLFPGETQGIREALDRAAKTGLISNYTCTFVEVKKTSSVPLRLFRVKSISETQNEIVNNPMVGTHYLMGTNNNEAFLCNTGYPYKHRGTAKPIHIAKIDGPMPFTQILEDIFYLANLTWTKVDDCSRDPLTIRMTDIRLREVAGDYDADAYDFAENESGGGEDE